MSTEQQKPVIGFSCGDLNGIGMEIIIKALSDSRIFDFCVPVIFASNKSINFYRKAIGENNFTFTAVKELTRLNPKVINVFNCWEEEVNITPGQLNETGGKYAYISLKSAVQACVYYPHDCQQVIYLYYRINRRVPLCRALKYCGNLC